jgi:hypothetical protein
MAGRLQPEPWATLPVVAQPGSEYGLLGLVLDPDFAGNGFVYVYSSYRGGPTGVTNRIVRLREQLATTGQTVPSQPRQPTARPTLRWLFRCFEGIDLHHGVHPDGTRTTQVLRLTTVHRLVLQLLGPAYDNAWLAIQETVD